MENKNQDKPVRPNMPKHLHVFSMSAYHEDINAYCDYLESDNKRLIDEKANMFKTLLIESKRADENDTKIVELNKTIEILVQDAASKCSNCQGRGLVLGMPCVTCTGSGKLIILPTIQTTLTAPKFGV